MSDAIKKALYDKMNEEYSSFMEKHPFVKYDSGGTGDVSSAIDSISGAPFRSAVGEMQEGNFSEALNSYKNQFGKDPEKSPSMEDIAIKAGVPEGGLSKAAGLIGSFAEPGIPGIGTVSKYKLPHINPGEAKIVSSPAYRESFEQALDLLKSKPPIKADILKNTRVEKSLETIKSPLDLENKLEELMAMRNKVHETLNSNKENFNNKKILSQYDNLDSQIKEIEEKLGKK